MKLFIADFPDRLYSNKDIKKTKNMTETGLEPTTTQFESEH